MKCENKEQSVPALSENLKIDFDVLELPNPKRNIPSIELTDVQDFEVLNMVGKDGCGY